MNISKNSYYSLTEALTKPTLNSVVIVEYNNSKQYLDFHLEFITINKPRPIIEQPIDDELIQWRKSTSLCLLKEGR